MKLTPSQSRKIQTLTSRIHRYFGATDYPQQHGAFSFDLTKFNDGSVMLSASNSNGLKWYETWHHFIIIVGTRGGVQRFEESMQDDKKRLACHRSLILD